MSISQSSQPIIIPDPQDPNYGPSADNIPNPSSTPGTPVTIASIANTAAAIFYNISNNFIVQPSPTSNYVYRLTFNGTLTGITIAGVGGNVIVYAILYHPDTSVDYIGGTSVYCSISANALYGYWSFSSVFIPLPGDIIRIYVSNNTGGIITNTTLKPTVRGCAIERVSTASAPTLIFS